MGAGARGLMTYVPLPGDGRPHTVTLIPGDGVGPEVTDAVVEVVEALGAPIIWERCAARDSAGECPAEQRQQKIVGWQAPTHRHSHTRQMSPASVAGPQCVQSSCSTCHLTASWSRVEYEVRSCNDTMRLMHRSRSYTRRFTRRAHPCAGSTTCPGPGRTASRTTWCPATCWRPSSATACA